MPLYTVGHGTRTTGELVSLLRQAGVRVLLDVRRHPGSRRHPHLGRDALARDVPAEGILYEWHGEVLGGRRNRSRTSRHPAWRVAAFQGYADHTDTEEFRSALDALVARSAATPCAVMCAETVWWRCHRRLIADAASVRGAEVVHLLDESHRTVHPLHPQLRVGDDGWPVYDVGVAPPLFDDA